MREAFIIQGFKELENKIQKVQKQNQGVNQEVITLRLQMNAIVRTVRWLFPLNLILKYLIKKEFKEYKEQLEGRKKQLEEMQKRVGEEKKPIKNMNIDRIGRNAKCYCGSGKKYKKCCIGIDCEQKLNNKNKETEEEYIKRQGKDGISEF